MRRRMNLSLWAIRPLWMAVVAAGLALAGFASGCRPEAELAELAVIECKAPKLSSAIVKGELTGDGAFGEVGTLFGVGVGPAIGAPEGSGLCSATLIAPDVVVTAAHCVGAYPAHRIRISTHPCPGPQDVEALADLRFVAVHPFWREDDPESAVAIEHERCVAAEKAEASCETRVGHDDAAAYWACINSLAPDFFADQGFIDGQTGDLAIAILDRPLQTHPLARLPSPREATTHLQIGHRLTAVGYGVAGRTINGDLAAGDRFAGRVGIDELGTEEMRINFAAARICNGDSGGPLLEQTPSGRLLLGVGVRFYASHLQHLDLCDGPGVATRIDYFVPWIRATIEAACASGARSHAMCTQYPI